jgi:hypothetical protein
VHPGSTPAATAAAAGGGRFLAYNQLGCVVSKAVDDHHVVEVRGGGQQQQQQIASWGRGEAVGQSCCVSCAGRLHHVDMHV